MTAECSEAVEVDWAAAQSLVAGVVRDVVGTGKTLSPSVSLEDLRQEGLEAILRASREYDPARKVPFPAYARKSVAFALRRYLRQCDPLPERSRRDLAALLKAEARLHAAGITQPTLAQLAEMAGLSPHRSLRVLREGYEAVPMAPTETSEGFDFPGLTGDTPEDRYILWEARERIRATLVSFTPRQRQVFQLRFVERRSVTQVADDLRLTKGRVSQIAAHVETLLRTALNGDD